jgi:hypothetical protein
MKIQISKWLIVIATFVSLMFVVTGLEAGKPPANPNKPPKSDNPKQTKTEWIAFTGDLVGSQEVEACCPNAGPSPRYTMFLPFGLYSYDDDVNPVYPIGYYDGELFMSSYGAADYGAAEYIIQFHACCTHVDSIDVCAEGLPEMKFEIIGGTSDSVGDKKAKGLVVTFEGELWWKDWNRDIAIGPVSFEMLRIQSQYCTDEICPTKP